MKTYLSAIIIAIGLFGGTAMGLWLSGRGSMLEIFRSKPTLGTNNASPGAPAPYAKGSEAAPVTMEEFADFQCSPCRQMHSQIRKIAADYGDRLRIVFRNFPLEMHPNALAAAKAAESAGRQGRFWEMHDMLFEKQSEWEDRDAPTEKFKEYAAVLRLDLQKFNADMASDEITQRITADQKRGESAGVDGTPTLFVNGVAVPEESFSPDGIRKLIDAAASR